MFSTQIPCTFPVTINAAITAEATGTGSGTGTYSTSISTSTMRSSSSSSTMQNGFPLLHVYGANGCQGLTVPTIISHFNSNLSVMNDRWMIESILSDSIHNYTAVLGMTTDHGNHTMFQRFYIAGQLAQNQTVPIDLAHLVSDNLSIVGPGPGQPLNSDVQKGQFIDQYSDAPINNTEMSGQNIWYGI